VTLSLCQDVQAEAYDYPESFFEEKIWSFRRPRPDDNELAGAIEAIRAAKAPVIISGGGTLYSLATKELTAFADRHGVPVVVTQAGKSSIDERHPLSMGSVGVTGTSAANALVREADVIIAVGTRLQDFTTGSWSVFGNPDVKFVAVNTASFDAAKHNALPVVGDAKVTLAALSAGLGGWTAPASLKDKAANVKAEWMRAAEKALAPTNAPLPSDAQVIGATARNRSGENTVLVCAAGGLPGELHKLWPATSPGSYHMEYGFSCMGYEIAGGLGVKMARPDADVVVMVGDGSYMMLNSELATSVMLGKKLTVVMLDNRGYGCINRLQMATGGANFNNLLKDAYYEELPDIDFRKHAEAMGAVALKVSSIADLEQALKDTRSNDRTTVIVIDTDPLLTTEEGGNWWDVAVPEVSPREQVNAARAAYVKALATQRIG
jgi:3D-(3,5/4)-trihydroxycyclohexane-1,2-dione acylhydrolase (decyclizing)